MLKYIIKRLGLSIIILVGVSMIIYFLVRLMPTDYLENSFSAQLGQGTITMEQINDLKLYMVLQIIHFRNSKRVFWMARKFI